MNAPAVTLSTVLASIADPPAKMMDSPAMDYFLIEVVNTLRESSAVAVARTKKVEQEMIEAGLLPPSGATGNGHSTTSSKRESTMRDSMGSNSMSMSKSDLSIPLEDEEEGLRQRLEAIGMHVGANIAERYAVPV
ncbi:hypothetical protein EUX98_g2619 [Antrodiella citrinella]|uniref:Uncharacterized protein n=1 Tax=Antrodiella citrinella TaxID=2447956 RepID=A0A4S4MYJ5_9APHY|nr:hypothetical protein EUX98_g2619 [Antrodiella citrinella]